MTKQKSFLYITFIIIVLCSFGVFFYWYSLKNTPKNFPINFDETLTNELKSIEVLIFKKEAKLLLLGAFEDTTVNFLTIENLVFSNADLGIKLQKSDIKISEGVYDLTSNNNFFYFSTPNNYIQSKLAINNLHFSVDSVFLSSSKDYEHYIYIRDTDFNKFSAVLGQFSTIPTHIAVLPYDFLNTRLAPPCHRCPSWIPELYSQLQLYQKKLYYPLTPDTLNIN